MLKFVSLCHSVSSDPETILKMSRVLPLRISPPSGFSASDINISKLTSLLHTAFAELKSLKEWQHLMQPKIDEVVEWLRDFRPHLTETVTRAAYELPQKLCCRCA
jgi:hypothetical protein